MGKKKSFVCFENHNNVQNREGNDVRTVFETILFFDSWHYVSIIFVLLEYGAVIVRCGISRRENLGYLSGIDLQSTRVIVETRKLLEPLMKAISL